MPIEYDKFYAPSDPALRAIAKTQTFAQWRYEKRGPAYFKAGSRVLYQGKDLINWLKKHRIEHAAH